MELNEVSDQFVEHCRVRNLSEHTFRAYRQDLNDFQNWVDRLDIQNPLSKEAITAWMMDMRERGQAPASIKRRIACVKVLCRWLEDEERLDENPFHKLRASVRLPRRLPRHLKQDELKALFGDRQHCPSSFKEMTLFLALELLLTTGIRVSELCTIKIQDIDLAAGNIFIKGKGNRERRVFLVDEMIKDQISSYIEERKIQGPLTDVLLISAHGSAGTPDYVRRIIHKHVEKLGLQRRITPHMLRHSAATQLLEHGVDIRHVQKLLGHSSISTTEIYTHVSDASLQEAIRFANPRRKI